MSDEITYNYYCLTGDCKVGNVTITKPEKYRCNEELCHKCEEPMKRMGQKSFKIGMSEANVNNMTQNHFYKRAKEYDREVIIPKKKEIAAREINNMKRK